MVLFLLLFHNTKGDLGRDLSHVFLPGHLGLCAMPCACPSPQLELVDYKNNLLIFGLASGPVVFEDPLEVFDPQEAVAIEVAVVEDGVFHKGLPLADLFSQALRGTEVRE